MEFPEGIASLTYHSVPDSAGKVEGARSHKKESRDVAVSASSSNTEAAAHTSTQSAKLGRMGIARWNIVGCLGRCRGVAWWMIRRASASDRLPPVKLDANQDLLYDLWKLEPGQTRFFTYPASPSDRSRLLVNRDSDGVVRVAFATCTTCYSFRRQHYLKEGKFICGQCQSPMTIGSPHEQMTRDKGCVAVPVPFR